MASMKPEDDLPRFPAFLDLRGKRAVIAGAGEIAAHKAQSLLRSGAQVVFVAPHACARVADWASHGKVVHHARRFEEGDLDGAELAVAATDDRAANAAVAKAAHARAILVNVVDDGAASSFVMAAIVERSPVQVAISTSGASPVLARRIGAMIERAVPAGVGTLAALAAEFRDTVRGRLPDVGARRKFWESVCDGPIGEKALAGEAGEARRLLERELERLLRK